MQQLSRRTRAMALGALLVVGAAACGSGAEQAQDGGGSEAAAAGEEAATIAFLMPCSECADRFENQDKPLFEAAVAEIDPSIEVIANNAEGDSDQQLAQAEAALTNGADVIVVSPLDESAGAAISDEAAQAGVPVVSYDGLITGAPTDYYISFDNEVVGELQGQFLADNLEPGSTVVMINGDQTIAPGRQFRAGAHRVLDPLFDSGELVLGFEGDAEQFDPAAGQALMEQALTQLSDQVDGVIGTNDGLAGAVGNALRPRNLLGEVLVTGQDATDAGLQRILLDEQSMSVYKAISEEARIAAEVAVALARGDRAAADELMTTTVDNDNGEVPAALLDPVVVTRDEVFDVVVEDGFTTRENICTGEAAAACP